MLRAQTIKYQGVALVRFAHREPSLPVREKTPFVDLDCTFELAEKLGRPEVKERAREFLTWLGWRLPLPVRAGTFTGIFSWKGFPPFDAWERQFPSYTYEDYLHDLAQFWRCRSRPKSYAQYLNSLSRSYLNCLACPSPQDRAAYARMALSGHWESLRDLKLICPENPLDEKIETIIRKIDVIAQSHYPPAKRNKKKIAAHSDDEGEDLPLQKKTMIDRQGAFW
jgi:hypothetical protein